MDNRGKIINGHRHIRYEQTGFSTNESLERSNRLFELLDHRRSVRHFSDKEVPAGIIENIIRTAGTAPSGAHKQPWKFCAVSNKELKSEIRKAAEKEELENYSGRMSERWLKDLAPLGTDSNKQFLEVAPWLIVVFKEVYALDEHGDKHNNYYVNESVGIACGMLIAAIHHAGLSTLTHTPSPMNFLATLLNRPENERAFLLLPVGYAAQDALVPDIKRKKFSEICRFYS